MSITVYGQDDCSYCEETRKYYERQGIPAEYVNLSNPANAKVLEKLREEGYSSTPIVRTQNQTWQGRRPDLMVKSAMEYRQEEQQRQQLQEQQLARQASQQHATH
ncbi:glutaredoxin family protein [Glutamicibacter sp. FBE19]|uniref:glutaredoxin family protein n=1 Tax=Glutamicibacter sp. FBE19 TaxID=2761534 RepID=UPI0018964E0A|nr:glutaredoxin family protein [Glutamicibacter sp. FBE19]MBF6671134.1 glutaredoxin family protein [Glutamicibacter sp. FBE19]